MHERSNTEATTVAQMQQHVHQLYSLHCDWLQSWLRRRLGCSHHAADLVHDAYVRIMSSERIPTLEQARPHLMQIAKGLLIDRYRRQQIEQAYLEALVHLPEPTAISPEERALTLEVLLRICAALDTLPSQVQQVFLLSRYEGLTYSAISQRQGIAVGTVRKYMLRATQVCFAVMSDISTRA